MTSDLTSTWDKILEYVKQEIGEMSFEKWFPQTRLASITEDCLVIEVPFNLFKDWIYDHYRDILNIAILRTIGKAIPIKFEIKEKTDPARNAQKPAASVDNRPIQKKPFYLNPKYTFEGFVVGASNRFAHAATLAIAESPARAYNPLFIYGGVGLGKTHLMQAACHYISETNKNLKLFYTSSESFTNELINAIQNRTTPKFREKYRNNVDVLLIDDVHFIAGKEATQEEFFHTFNTLYDAHKQIVLSSDRQPKTIPGLEERLVSRFEWGLVTDVQPPDFETRIAILKKKAERNSVALPDDVLYFIAEKIKTNVRELEGALIKVIAYASLENKKIDTALTKEVLKDVLGEKDKKISVDMIQDKVAGYFDLKLSDMKTKKRTRQVAYPRQVAMYLARELTKLTLPEIGEYFGGRDHSTVIHACSKIEKDSKKSQNVKNLINKLMLEINS